MRLPHRQRPKHERVDDREHRRIRPDAQREREHGHGGEPGVLQHLAEGEFEVVHSSWSGVALSASGLFIPSNSSIPGSRRQRSEP